MNSPQHRRGAVLLVVVGLSVVLLGLAVTYVASIRSDALAVRSLTLQAQCRVMVDAACLYILESGRIGWGEEAYGWLDIRDASLLDRSRALSDPLNPVPGPRGRDGRQLPKLPSGAWAVNPAAVPILRWPALGGVARVTMLPPVLPPYATKGRFAYNPVPYQRAALTQPDMAQYLNLDPQPANFPDSEPVAAWSYAATDHADWARGSRSNAADPASLALRSRGAVAWFRICRVHFDTFIITVGAGGSQGYRDWSEVQAAGASAQFFDDQRLFDDLAADDSRLWYEARWSPSVLSRAGALYPGQVRIVNRPSPDGTTGTGATYVLGNPGLELMPMNFDVDHFKDSYGAPNRTMPINQMGTIAYLRRLDREPLAW